jgi:hypothetical protein
MKGRPELVHWLSSELQGKATATTFIEPRAAGSSSTKELGRHCKSLKLSMDNIGFLKSGQIPSAVFQSRDCRRNRANNEPSSPRCLITTTIITPDTTTADRAACGKTQRKIIA